MNIDWDQMNAYLSHHPRWFEDFTQRAPSSEHLREYRRAMPGDWSLRRNGYWMIATPPDDTMPEQGWKLHVTATSRTGAATLRQALPVLRDSRVRFKFLMDPAALLEFNGKSFGRGSSGKFIAIYPADEERFHTVARALTEALAGFEGPYILSDRRYPGSRAVYYRYGGFTAQPRMRATGRRELVIQEPDGSEVPDRRTPYWTTPDWTTDPVAPVPAAVPMDDQITLAGGRFVVDSAMGFSNRGGLYRGTDTETDAEVVLREARPGVEIGPTAVDAVTLLRREYDLLTELSDTGKFIRPITFFTEWEHAFIAQEYIEGDNIGHLALTQNPIYTLDLTPERLTAYYERFRALWAQLADAVATSHERGIVLNDLSPANVMITPDDEVRVIDLECAFHEGDEDVIGMYTMGMVTRRALAAYRGDRRSDYYALGGIIQACIVTCFQADAVNRDIPRQLLTDAAADLDLPDELVALVRDLRDEDAPAPDPAEIRRRIDEIPFAGHWRQAPPLSRRVTPEPTATNELHKRIEATLDGIVDYLHTIADTHRTDRLFPANLVVFQTNPLSLAYGAYGCFHALQVVRGTVPDRLFAWALERSTAHDTLPPGLYYGSAGVAWAQSALGHHDLAVATLRTALSHPLIHTEPSVLAGSAGIGMACLRLWRDTGRTEFLDQATEIGAHLATTAVRGDGTAHWPQEDGTTLVGYGYGASGVAMFLLALHAATGDRATLELGRAALDFDLSCGEHMPTGLESFPAVPATDGERSSVLRQYWDKGTAGILTTALRYHAVTGDPALRTRIDEILPDVYRKYVAFPALFHGASGIGNALLDAYEYLGDPELLGGAQRCASLVLQHVTERPEGIAFPGEQLLRESCDLATGSAGVALFLHRLPHARPGARTNQNFLLDDLLDELSEHRP